MAVTDVWLFGGGDLVICQHEVVERSCVASCKVYWKQTSQYQSLAIRLLALTASGFSKVLELVFEDAVVCP